MLKRWRSAGVCWSRPQATQPKTGTLEAWLMSPRLPGQSSQEVRTENQVILTAWSCMSTKEEWSTSPPGAPELPTFRFRFGWMQEKTAQMAVLDGKGEFCPHRCLCCLHHGELSAGSNASSARPLKRDKHADTQRVPAVGNPRCCQPQPLWTEQSGCRELSQSRLDAILELPHSHLRLKMGFSRIPRDIRQPLAFFCHRFSASTPPRSALPAVIGCVVNCRQTAKQ